ncbi:hypothetical protein Scep_030479 [Stephania cephalantha]|uniref:Uncharacterized protein n=1 Tax=Stephania cephalantha TaxID=152367 RepID=A0AAP0E7H0_9MAGN
MKYRYIRHVQRWIREEDIPDGSTMRDTSLHFPLILQLLLMRENTWTTSFYSLMVMMVMTRFTRNLRLHRLHNNNHKKQQSQQQQHLPHYPMFYGVIPPPEISNGFS